MSINPNNYDHRGGGNYGVVLRCRELVGDRLVYFDKNNDSGSWVIRDFITGKKRSNGSPTRRTSSLTFQEIESISDSDEFPPWRNVEDYPDDWEVYLRLRTSAALHCKNINTSLSDIEPGEWEDI